MSRSALLITASRVQMLFMIMEKDTAFRLFLSLAWFIITIPPTIPSSVWTSPTPIHKLCGDSGEVSSIESSYGTIKYTATCNSTGLAHSYAVIEGVAVGSDQYPCQGYSGKLNISSITFCIDSTIPSVWTSLVIRIIDYHSDRDYTIIHHQILHYW